jgi:hypothetical protein
VYNRGLSERPAFGYMLGDLKEGANRMNSKARIVVGVLTAVAMALLTFALPRGGAIRDAAVVQFPMTAGIWAIFALLFVRLK